MKMRKILAVLTAVLMLCAIIPMGAISVSAAAILEYDFEDGSLGSWKYDTTNDTLEVIDGVMTWTTASWKNTYHNFKPTANTDYKLTMRVKADVSATTEVKFLNGSWGSTDITKYTPTFTTEWAEYTYIFNSLSNTSLVLLFQSHKATTIYIDSIKIEQYVAPVDPVFPEDAIYTETFESAALGNWSSSTSSVVSTEGLAATNAEGGNYCLEFISPNYSYTNYQLTVEPNTDYIVTFSILSATSGYPINARIRGNDEDLALVQYTPSTAAWETHSYLFNSGDYTSVGLRFQAGWATGTYYLDNISVAPFDVSTLSDDGHVVNGGFESGNSVGWNASAYTAIVADPTGADQGYVIKTFEAGSGVDMFTQTFKNLVAGETYTISFKVYGYGTATNNTFFVRIPKDATFSNPTGITTGDSGKTYVARFNLNSSTGAWHTVTLDFVPAASTALIQFQNYRTDQGFYYFDDITLSHVYDAVVTDPDCVNAGYTTYTCACGNTYTEAGADALGHSYADGVCSVCGAEDPDYVPACEHEYDNACDADCNLCGEVREVAGHNYEGAETTAPTCGAVGEMTYTCSNCGDSYTEEIAATGAHEYFYPCDPVCMNCYEITNPDATHTIVAVEAVAATCTENGNIAYWYCSDCGSAWADEALTQITNQMSVIVPAAHTYTDNCDFDCDVCGEYRDAPHNLTTHVEAVVPANCQEEGYNEHWICEDCGGYFMDNGAGGYYQTNPAWMYYTGDHVRPEGAAACAVVPCTLCGEDSYGTESCVRPEGSYVCQNDTCVNCGGLIFGEGCTYGYDEDWNSLSPFCQPGDCIYCGTHYEYLYECENGSYAPCSVDGECVYGCGKQYPATGEHQVDDPCAGGTCWQCWETIEGAHAYDDEYDIDCNVCGAVRDVVAPINKTGFSASEDVSGLAVRFQVALEGMGIDGTTAVYDNATYKGYKLVSMGAIATNGVSTKDIPVVYLCDDDVSTGAQFAIRIKNIPADKLDAEITFTPYVIVEIDGEQITIYGEAQTGTYNQYGG